MKRMGLAVILAMVLALVLYTSTGVLGAEPKPPTQLCLYMDGWWDNLVLLNKPMGNVKTSEGPVKFYAIHGEQYYYTQYSAAMSGTGHVKAGIYHFSVSGSYSDSGIGYTFLVEGKWNLNAQNGTYSIRYITSTGYSSYFTSTLSAVNCTDCTLPY